MDAEVASIALIYAEMCGDRFLTALQFGERVLTDDAYAQEITARMNLVQYVTSEAPAAFLSACRDDSVVDPLNTILMAEAYQKAGARYEMHLFTEGGHGYGVRQEDVPPMYGHNGFNMEGTRDWIRLYVTWLRKTV